MSISDEIVLMRNGRLQQCAAAQELYHQPANLFAAAFLGNPPINLLRGVWAEGAVGQDDGVARIPLPRGAAPAEGARVVLAIRPESFAIADDGIPWLADDVFEIGRERIATLRLGAWAARAFIPGETALAKGDTVRLMPARRGVFLFDEDTEARLL